MEMARIDVTVLREDERCELARLLFKCGYSVEPYKEKQGNRNKYQVIFSRKAGNSI